MLLDNGAANIILLGRSGDSNPDVAGLIQQYNRPRSGIHVRAISCDITSRANLAEALHTVSDLPPIRGVIHCSLFLRDSMSMNATFKDWQKINGPKVDAAWHIHDMLPNLDFFRRPRFGNRHRWQYRPKHIRRDFNFSRSIHAVPPL
jgi:hypothetical protein